MELIHVQKVNLYVCSHKDYVNSDITNKCYRLISDKPVKNNSALSFIQSDGFLDNRLWSELSHMYYVWKHEDLQADWIGFVHYRRYFSWLNDIPELTKPILAKHIVLPYSVYMQYDVCHNSNDLKLMLDIIYTLEKEYYCTAIEVYDGHIYFPYNMYVLPKIVFNEFCNFIFKILNTVDAVYNIHNDYTNMCQHICENSNRYIDKLQYPQTTVRYQARLYGFLAERLLSIWFTKYIKEHGQQSVIESEVITTEPTYNKT